MNIETAEEPQPTEKPIPYTGMVIEKSPTRQRIFYLFSFTRSFLYLLHLDESMLKK